MSADQMQLFTTARAIKKDMTGFVLDNITAILPAARRSIFYGSPFEKLRNGGPHTRGKAGETLTKILAYRLGYTVGPSVPGDVLVNGVDVEVKTAMQAETGRFIVNQLRRQDYKYVVIWVITPGSARLFTVPKDVIFDMATGQHGGGDALETRVYIASSLDKLLQQLGEYEGVKVFERYLGHAR